MIAPHAAPALEGGGPIPWSFPMAICRIVDDDGQIIATISDPDEVRAILSEHVHRKPSRGARPCC